MLSPVRLCDPVDRSSPQGPPSMGFSRRQYWSGLPFPPPGDLQDPGIEPAALASPAPAGGFLTTIATWEAKDVSRRGQASLRWESCFILWVPLHAGSLPPRPEPGLGRGRGSAWMWQALGVQLGGRGWNTWTFLLAWKGRVTWLRWVT